MYDGEFLATKSAKQMPIALSYIAAGEASEIFEDYEMLDINEMVTRGREGFIAYRVTGDSMLEYIKPGYMVFVDPYCEPKVGDIIVSRINGKNCVKIFQKTRKGLYLVSANKNYPPKEVKRTDDFQILGVVKGHLAVY